MTAGIKKNEFLGKLGANLPQDVSLPVVHAIVDNVDPILGVAFAKYEKYAEESATGLRTVARTIPALHRIGLLRKQARHDGPPVLWLPEIMDMQADEALRRAAWLAQQKDENPQNYFTGRNGNVAGCAHARRASEQAHDKIDVEGQPNTNAPAHSLDTGTQLESRQRRAKAKSPVHANDREILRLVHGELDPRGLTLEDPEALSIAIRALGNSRPERIRHLDGRALRKAYQRARARLPQGYDRWVLLIEKWDKSYERRKARGLVDRLVTAVGDRPLGILDDLFDHLEQQICDHWPKKVRRLELEYSLLKSREYYLPQLRPLKTDAIKEQVYAALADGPKTKEELARMFGKTVGAISSVGLRLRNESKIRSIWRGGQFMWARASTAARFIPACDAILAVLKKGPMIVPELAQKTGKARSTVKCALHRHLLPKGEVIRTKFGTYALAGTEPLYISKRDAIIAALKEGPMTVRTLAQVTCTTPTSLYQFIDPLLANSKVIRIKHGTYALARTAPVFITTCDAIIRALSKQAMRLGPLVKNINKSTNISRSRGTVTTVLARLKKEGTVKQDRRGGEYRLARRGPPLRRGERVRGGSGLRWPKLGEKEVPPSTIGSSFAARRGRRFKSYPSDQRNSGSADTAHKRVGRRVKLRKDSRGNYSSRKCIPDEVRAEYARLYGPRSEVKFSAPASVGSAEAKRRFREWDAETTSRFEAIRKTPRGESKDASIFEEPNSLASTTERHARGRMVPMRQQ